jgi:hypothetical protein
LLGIVEHVSPRRFYTQAFEETPMITTLFSRHKKQTRRTKAVRYEVDLLEGRALLSNVPMVMAMAASGYSNGIVGVHVTGDVADPGQTLSPVLGFQIVSSTGRIVETGTAPLLVSPANPSAGMFNFWLGLTPSQLSTAVGQKYTINVVASDMNRDMGFAPAAIPSYAMPPGVVEPLTSGTTGNSPLSTPPSPPGYVDYTHGIVYNGMTVAPSTVSPPPAGKAPGYVDYVHGIVYN